ncbi:hypothetical protein U1Q18_025292 [Sarracenia purpurea var. burkii]
MVLVQSGGVAQWCRWCWCIVSRWRRTGSWLGGTTQVRGTEGDEKGGEHRIDQSWFSTSRRVDSTARGKGARPVEDKAGERVVEIEMVHREHSDGAATVKAEALCA